MADMKTNHLLYAIVSIRQLADLSGSTAREIIDYAYEHLPVRGKKRTVQNTMRKVLKDGVYLGVLDETDGRYMNNILADNMLGLTAENEKDDRGDGQGSSKEIEIIDLTGDDTDEEEVPVVADKRLGKELYGESVSDFQSDNNEEIDVASDLSMEIDSEARTEEASYADIEESDLGTEVDEDINDGVSERISDDEKVKNVAKRKRHLSEVSSSENSSGSTVSVSHRNSEILRIVSDKKREKVPRKFSRVTLPTLKNVTTVSGRGCNKMAKTKTRYSKRALDVLKKAITLQIAKQNLQPYKSTDVKKLSRKSLKKTEPGKNPGPSRCGDEIQATTSIKKGVSSLKVKSEKKLKGILQKVVDGIDKGVKTLESTSIVTPHSTKSVVGSDGECGGHVDKEEVKKRKFHEEDSNSEHKCETSF